MKFHAYGHKFVKSTHKTTLEFTKEDFLTETGDCILGINSDFDIENIRKMFNKDDKLKIILRIGSFVDEIHAEYNPGFDSHALIIRKSEYVDKRTFAIRADKAANDIKRTLVNEMKKPSAKMIVEIIIE